MPLSAVDVVSPAFERMKSHLFKPFRLGHWLRLALVGFLAGEMGQSGGCSVRAPLELLTSNTSNQFQGPLSPQRGVLFFVGIAILFLLILVLAVLFAYLSSRMRFVLFDSVVNGECRIRDSWRRRGVPAFRYFLFQLLLGLIGMLGLLALVGVPLLLVFRLGWFQNPGQHILGFILGGAMLLFVFLIWTVSMLLVQILTKDFVVPQMAVEGVPLSEGWNRLWVWIKEDKAGYAGYLAMKFILAVAAAVITGIAAFTVMIILVIPFGLVALAGILVGQAAGLGWNPVTIAVAVVFGSAAFLALLLLVCLVSVPAIVFFPAYSLHFFAERYAALGALLYPPPPAEPDLNSLSPQP